MEEEMMQRSFNEDIPTIVNASEPHMACLLLLDTSGSMGGEPIRELNEGLNKFKLDVCEDKTTRDVLDIAIVEFNSGLNVVQEFVPIEYMEPVNLVANGGTNMSPAIQKAIDMVNERSRFYRRSGTEPYKPWIIMISDGAPQDDITEIVKVIQDMEENEKLKFFSLGVEGYDPQTLHRLSGPKVMKLKGYDFSSFFDWVNKSMRSVSVSSPGEKPKGVPLPDNVDKDTDDWM
ncbi:MAG: VWA domain-containing protein [Butyrivibrio sp.]|uniref:vWA domain-containing protein n=1 Tax=Butyrivibrio sp. TaxID=28121 RepID=UPI001B0CD65D|nr:VWA domain-containing protein [Butyrivibrio sp.]MBO6242004.1 VWA domain-containing protein [Butyrivibrio sp.]